MKIVSQNRKAYFNYTIEEEIESGIMLVGSEIKAIRAGHVNISDGYVVEKSGELFVVSVSIGVHKGAAIDAHAERRERKLLLHKREMAKMIGKINVKGYSLVPTKLILNNRGVAKLMLGLAKGKKLYDKRETIKKRDEQRSKDRGED